MADDDGGLCASDSASDSCDLSPLTGSLLAEMTQEEVASVLGISRAMVYKVERRAIAKMRKAFDAEGWRFDGF